MITLILYTLDLLPLSKGMIFGVVILELLVEQIVLYSWNAYEKSKMDFHMEWIDGDETTIHKAISRLDPREFEWFISELFKLKGYNTELTQQTNDGGKDVIAYLDDGTAYIECKKYTKGVSTIGREVVNKLAGTMIGDSVYHGIICTTGDINNKALKEIDKINNNGIIEIQVMYLSDIINLCYECDPDKVCTLLSICKKKEWIRSGFVRCD